MAYSKKGSQASLVASSTITGALLLSAALMSGPLRVPATLLALGESSCLFWLEPIVAQARSGCITSCVSRGWIKFEQGLYILYSTVEHTL